MSRDFYNGTVAVLGVIAVIAIAVAAFYLITGLIRWRQPDRNRRLRRGGAAVAVFCFAVVAVYSILYFVYLPSLARAARSARQQHYDAASLVKVGDVVPSFEITTLEGTAIDSGALRGKVVLVSFFATWCGPCIQELPHIQKIWDEYRGRDDFALVVIGREETDESVTAFRMERGFTFPIAADPERLVYSTFAKELIPRTYLIGRDGKVRFATIGFYEEEIEKLKTEVARELATPGHAQ